MPGTMENLQTINSFFRTVLALILLGGVGTAGWYGYTTFNAAELESKRKEKEIEETSLALTAAQQRLEESRQEVAEKNEALEQRDRELADKQQVIDGQTREISSLNEDIEQKEAEIQRLDTALRLHKMQRRLGRITVLDVATDPETDITRSRIEFVELNDLGDEIGEPMEFEIEGDVIFVDYLVVTFEDRYVESADLERGTSICSFNRIFGEYQKPKDGYQLDKPGQFPSSYARGSVPTELEKKIWNDFWEIANDTKKATELGIRTIHGVAPSIKVKKGKRYRVTVRAAAGPEIEVDENAATLRRLPAYS
jgi:hypothetical protein